MTSVAQIKHKKKSERSKKLKKILFLSKIITIKLYLTFLRTYTKILTKVNMHKKALRSV